MLKNILIVDDEKDIVSFVQDFFVDEGYDVSVAFCGEEAKTRIENQEPILIILDMKMPGIDGPALLKLINEKSPFSKVIVLTGYGQEYTEKIKHLRYEGFMTKPFSAMELVNTAKDILAGNIRARKDGTPLLNDPHIVPKAKLLFVEPKELAVTGKRVYFLNKEKCGGEYELELIVKVDKIEEKLKEFKPDIVLSDICVLNAHEELRSKIMNSQHKPKDIILFGHSTDAKEDENFVEGQFDPLTAIFVKDMMDKLGKIVRQACITNRLYVKSERPVRIPGLELRNPDSDKKEATAEDIPAMLRSAISEHLNIPEDKIRDDTNLVKDLGMNTLQSIQINIDLEEELGFEIPDDDAERLSTFREMVEYLKERFKSNKKR